VNYSVCCSTSHYCISSLPQSFIPRRKQLIHFSAVGNIAFIIDALFRDEHFRVLPFSAWRWETLFSDTSRKRVDRHRVFRKLLRATHCIRLPEATRGGQRRLEVARATFSNSYSAPVPKFLNPGPKNLQNWESDSCSESGNIRCRQNWAMLVLRIGHRATQAPAAAESDRGSGFSLVFVSGSERKT